nr:EOG090X03G5 [Ceriodaphnia reticulata]
MESSGGRFRSGHGPKLHIPQSDLMCKTGCGFFGNIAWQGYCSKCYKEYFLQRQQHQAAYLPSPSPSMKVDRKVARSQSDASTFFSKTESASSTLPRHGFSRFEEKKRHNQEMRATAVKSLFRKTPTKLGSPKSKDKRALSPESHSAILDLDQFLQTLPQNAAHHAYSFLRVQAEKLDRLVSSGVLTSLDLSDRVHNIYQVFDDKLKNHSGFLDMNSSSVETLLDQSERYLTRLLYKKLFCPPNCDDEERDLAVQKRIRSLNWISAPLLDCRINELDSKVRDILEKAITHLIEMDGLRAPQDKLASIINCSKLVFEMLGLSNSSNVDQLREKSENSDEQGETKVEEQRKEPTSQPVSADDFLPALIYVVLRANPPRIHSNLNFITRFAAPGRLLQGEGGYYFTNLCCAVSFLENLTSDSLGLSADEFDRYMSGKSIPFASLQAGVMVSEGLRLMYQNMSTLSELKHKQIHLQQQILELKNDMETFNECMSREVVESLQQYPVQIRSKRAPIKPDELPNIDELVPLAVPVSLVFFDDWESEFQEKGLDCIAHILNQNPICLLQQGWPAVIFSSLKKNLEFGDKMRLFKCLDICLKAQNWNPTDPACWNQNDEYDSLVNDLLQSMIVQDSTDKAKTNLEILVILFHSVQIKMAKFLPSIISIMDSYVAVGASPDILLLVSEVLEQMLIHCWDCLDQFSTHLSWILFKLDEHRPSPNNDVTCRISRCKTLLQRTFPPHIPECDSR